MVNRGLVKMRVLLFQAALSFVLAGSFLPGQATAADAAAPAWDDLPPIQPAAGDWPWWRGPNRDNIAAAGQEPPLHWSATENVVWKAEVPGRGHATPCLWGERLFLPTADDKLQVQYLLCYERLSGKPLWQKELHRGGFMPLHAKNSHASPMPACDGQHVFQTLIFQGGIWLTALDFSGAIVWQKKLGDFKSMHGYGASPLFYKSLVIVPADSLQKSFMIALHRKTGEIVWRIERPDYKLGTYASPVVGRIAGRDQLVIQGPYKVFSYAPATGKPLWTCDGPNESATSTVSFNEECIWASAGFPRKNLLCIRGDGSGDVTATHIVWKKEDNVNTYVPSMLLADGLLYMVVDDGKVVCFEAKTGQVVWESKLRGAFSSSPVLAGGNIYVVSETGMMFIFKPGRKFELVGQNDLANGGFATPVISGGCIYLRTLNYLFCLGKTK
ncbi:MAG: PQQ-binding-like beta-propeller repeat protein [Planctomycetota bacterium]